LSYKPFDAYSFVPITFEISGVSGPHTSRVVAFNSYPFVAVGNSVNAPSCYARGFEITTIVSIVPRRPDPVMGSRAVDTNTRTAISYEITPMVGHISGIGGMAVYATTGCTRGFALYANAG